MYEANPNAPIDPVLLAAETAIVNMKRQLAAAPPGTENYRRAAANLNALIGLYNAYEHEIAAARRQTKFYKELAEINAKGYFDEMEFNTKLSFELLLANLQIDDLQTRLKKYEPLNEPPKCQLKP